MQTFFYSIAALLFICGCSCTVEVVQPYEPEGLYVDPLNLSIALGKSANCFFSKCSSPEVGRTNSCLPFFVETMNNDGVFASVKILGSDADLVVDFLHYHDVDNNISRKEALYRAVMTLSGLGFLPPFPFTVYLKSEHIMKVSAILHGKEYYLTSYVYGSNSRIKTSGILTARYNRKALSQSFMMHVLPFFNDRVRADILYYRRVEEALRDGDDLALINLSQL